MPRHQVEIEVVRSGDSVPVEEVLALVDRVSPPGAEPGLSEAKRIDLQSAAQRGFAAALARLDDRLVGYAQAKLGSDGWALEVVSHPSYAGSAARLSIDMVRTIVQSLRSADSRVRYWTTDATVEADEALADMGFRLDREQLQMRVALPLSQAVSRGAPIAVRAFRPGADDEAWLALNNRSFADHPEQGNWTMGVLRQRLSQEWFDPRGFLITERGGRMAGSCWTKVHRNTAPPMGEIYVIGVDPDFVGQGLGRSLVVAGLDWLAGKGLRVGMLFTDASNAAAVALYESLGFTEQRRDRVYSLARP